MPDMGQRLKCFRPSLQGQFGIANTEAVLREEGLRMADSARSDELRS